MFLPESPKILIVDDLRDNLLIFEDMLSKLGAILVLASGGQEAIDLLSKDVYAMVLLDVDMPGIGGFEVADAMKKMNLVYPTPILFVTGVEKGGKKILKGYELGAVDYILKPFDARLLQSKTKVFLELYSQRIEIQEEVASRREAEYNLRITTQNLQSIIDGIPESICILDSKCAIKKINPAGTWLFGQESSTFVMEKRFVQFIHKDDRASFEECLANSLKGAQSYCEVRFYRNESTEKLLEITMVPLKVDFNEVDQVMFFSIDITDKKVIEKKTIKSEEKLFQEKIALEKDLLELDRFNQEIVLKCRNYEEKVKSSIDRLLAPLLNRLKMSAGVELQPFLQLIQKILEDLATDGKHKLVLAYSSLSEKEIEICNLIKCGYSTKEISEALELSEKTIQTHRSKIRRKLGISNKDVNLSTHLQSI